MKPYSADSRCTKPSAIHNTEHQTLITIITRVPALSLTIYHVKVIS